MPLLSLSFVHTLCRNSSNYYKHITHSYWRVFDCEAKWRVLGWSIPRIRMHTISHSAIAYTWQSLSLWTKDEIPKNNNMLTTRCLSLRFRSSHLFFFRPNFSHATNAFLFATYPACVCVCVIYVLFSFVADAIHQTNMLCCKHFG